MALITPEGKTIPYTTEYPQNFTIHPEVSSSAQPSPAQPSPAQPSSDINWNQIIEQVMAQRAESKPGQPSTGQATAAPLANSSMVEQNSLYKEVYDKVMADIMNQNQSLQKEIVDLKAKNMQYALIGNLQQAPQKTAEEALADFFGYNKENK